MTTRITVRNDGGSHAVRIDTPTGATVHLQPGEEHALYVYGQQQVTVREGAAVAETPAESEPEREQPAEDADSEAAQRAHDEAVFGDHNIPEGAQAVEGSASFEVGAEAEVRQSTGA